MDTNASKKSLAHIEKLNGDTLHVNKSQTFIDGNDGEIDKAKALIIVEIIEYVPNSVLSKTIIKKSTGNISIMSFDVGEALSEKISPFDTFAQVIDGRAEIVIDGKSNFVETGQGIILPAHIPNTICANERFKMILTVIKSGYE